MLRTEHQEVHGFLPQDMHPHKCSSKKEHSRGPCGTVGMEGELGWVWWVTRGQSLSMLTWTCLRLTSIEQFVPWTGFSMYVVREYNDKASPLLNSAAISIRTNTLATHLNHPLILLCIDKNFRKLKFLIKPEFLYGNKISAIIILINYVHDSIICMHIVIHVMYTCTHTCTCMFIYSTGHRKGKRVIHLRNVSNNWIHIYIKSRGQTCG